MIKVPLIGKFKGMYALVDDCDAWVLKFRWCGRRDTSGIIYAHISTRKEGLNGTSLHRLILGLKPGDPDVDHIDSDGLNCQRSNLRLATNSQNQMNQRKTRGTSSYKGVYWHKCDKKWMAYIKRDSRKIYLGCYAFEIEAAKAYDKKAKELFGDYARLNFPNINRRITYAICA